MKNLANCKPTEFLKQTNLIRKSVERWLNVTGIMEIRKNVPKLEEISKDMDADAVEAVMAENEKKMTEQANKNFRAILNSIMDEHPDETLELLALLCFVEPAKVDDYRIDEYLESITEMLSNKAVIGFFTSLVQWDQMRIFSASRP